MTDEAHAHFIEASHLRDLLQAETRKVKDLEAEVARLTAYGIRMHDDFHAAVVRITELEAYIEEDRKIRIERYEKLKSERDELAANPETALTL